jgi:molecular chaperone GrpE (heat shock protein)
MMPREPEEEQNNQINQTPTGEVEAEASETEDIETLKETLAEVKAKAEANLAGWQRAQADFINYKKRSEQEKQDLGKFANSVLILNLQFHPAQNGKTELAGRYKAHRAQAVGRPAGTGGVPD